MKKLYFTVLAACAAFTMSAQTNLSFENWNQGNPVDWDYFGQGTHMNAFQNAGDLTDDNGDPVVPSEEKTDVPTDGGSYVRMTSFLLSNSIDPQNLPDGPYGSVNYQLFSSTDKYEDVSFDVKYDVLGSDEALIFVQANDANGDPVGQGYTQLTGSQANFSTETVTINYTTSEPIVEYEIIVSSSIGEVFNNVGGNPAPTPEPGSILDVDNIVLGNIIIDAPNVSNVVASDISDNGDGSDLEVTFDVPNDESDIANYWIVASDENITPGALPDPLTFFQNAGIQSTPDGSNKTVNFAAGDVYYYVDNGQAAQTPIVEDSLMVVWVYVEGQNGAGDVFKASNQITLTSQTTGIDSEALSTVKAYPNPAKNNVNFVVPNAEGTLTITSVTGQTVVSQPVENEVEKVNTHALNNGVYIYTVQDNAGQVIKTNKLVINK